MADKLPPDEPGAEERFEHALANALASPPKPYNGKLERESKTPRKDDKAS